jgi:hypothetical protein
MTKKFRDIEAVVMDALRLAARDYRTDRGRFLVFAENRIHSALIDYEKALKHVPKGRYAYSGKRQHPLDIDAIRRGCMMAGCD